MMQYVEARPRFWRAMIAPAAMAGMALALVHGPAFASDPGVDEEVTFSRDIAPILQQNCQVCHQPGSIAPMSLINYDEVRPWARVIKLRVETGRMPPYHIDSDVGIQKFKNDARLSSEEIAKISAWVDAGAPEGNPADLPEPVSFPTGEEWTLAGDFGQPDLVIKSEPFTVGATGQDSWWRPTTPTNVDRARWIKAVEVKPSYPSGHAITHHVLAMLLQDESQGPRTAGATQGTGGLLTEYAIGKVGEIYPENTGKLLLPGSQIRWEVHYNPSGEEVVDDQVELGVWFHPEDYSPKYRTILQIFYVADTESLEIAPGEIATHQNFYVLKNPTRLESFQPHMHMRGKGMSMEAIYPDGKRELLSTVSDFDWRWHVNYIYDPDSAPLLPAGTVLSFTSWHDNTHENIHNPDADQFVTWGDRTVDEMSHAWVGLTYLEQDDFDQQVAEREAKRAQAEAEGTTTAQR